MSSRTFAAVLALAVTLATGNAHAKLKAGDTCILKSPVKVNTKPRGKGRSLQLDAGTELVVEELRGRLMRLRAEGKTVWLKRGKLRNKCGGAEAIPDPVFESEPAPTETVEATEVTQTPAGEESGDDALLFEVGSEEPVSEEPEDEDDDPSEVAGEVTGGDFGALAVTALAGLGAGAQGDTTRFTFDLALDASWRLFDDIAVGAQLFLHGTPGVGYGFGGLTVSGRYTLPALESIEPYAQAGIGGGYGAAGELTGVFAARLTGGGRMLVWDRLFLSGEVTLIVSQLSVAGVLDVGAGWSF